MHTIAVCDSEPVAIEGLIRLLEPVEGLRVVAAENSLFDGMDAVRELRPSMAIVDKALGLSSVLDWVASARRGAPPVPMIVWGASVTDSEAMRLLHAGAAGVVRKTASLDCILACIRTVADGGTWLEAAAAATSERPVRPGHSPLTARELQVLELIEQGCKNKDIAASLGIRVGTVKIHVKHIFEKTGVRGRYGLAISGMRKKPVAIAN